jgi:hypothetical protein
VPCFVTVLLANGTCKAMQQLGMAEKRRSRSLYPNDAGGMRLGIDRQKAGVRAYGGVWSAKRVLSILWYV